MKTYKFKINDKPYEVRIDSIEGRTANVSVNGTAYTVELEDAPATPATPAATAVPSPVRTPGQTEGGAVSKGQTAGGSANGSAAGGQDVTSPLPGVILSVKVAVGDKVSEGQSVAVLEAMKMENEIEADCAGTVTAIHVQKGDSVLEGAKIITIS